MLDRPAAQAIEEERRRRKRSQSYSTRGHAPARSAARGRSAGRCEDEERGLLRRDPRHQTSRLSLVAARTLRRRSAAATRSRDRRERSDAPARRRADDGPALAAAAEDARSHGIACRPRRPSSRLAPARPLARAVTRFRLGSLRRPPRCVRTSPMMGRVPHGSLSHVDGSARRRISAEVTVDGGGVPRPVLARRGTLAWSAGGPGAWGPVSARVGSSGRIRTYDPPVNSRMLYR